MSLQEEPRLSLAECLKTRVRALAVCDPSLVLTRRKHSLAPWQVESISLGLTEDGCGFYYLFRASGNEICISVLVLPEKAAVHQRK